MDEKALLEFRAKKDDVFRLQPQSPLSVRQQEKFTGLTYFQPAAEFEFELDLHIFEKQENLQIQTTTGEMRWYLRLGEFRFSVDGKEARLTLYQIPPGHYFLPFVDTLANTETYPAGRYLEPEELSENRFLLDFNMAYNPYCAYSPHYSCPITPAENRLSVAIRAGEKIPGGDWIMK